MDDRLILDQELNELGWWSFWTKVSMLGGDSYLMTSHAFNEPLFNHAAIFADGPFAEAQVETALEKFGEAGVRPCFFIVDDPAYSGTRSLLESEGFKVIDTMEVLKAGEPMQAERSRLSFVPANGDVASWVKAYVSSFYGSDAPVPEILSAAKNAAEDEDVFLVLAKSGTEVKGELALFRQGGLLGAYCVGTVPGFRGTGVATEMLAHARGLAATLGLSLTLQTFAGDGLVDFYLDRGFERAYTKMVLSRGPDTE